jgi:predicted O-methyltransferase YrrM
MDAAGPPSAPASLAAVAGHLAREARWLADLRLFRALRRVRRAIKGDRRPCPDNPRRRSYGDIFWSPNPWWCEQFYAMLRRDRPARVLEVGTSLGLTGLYLAAALERNRGGHFFTIEAGPAKAAYAQALFTAFGAARVTGLQGMSQTVLSDLLRSEPVFDWILVDIDHRYESTVAHLALLAPHVRTGGWLLFDDITLNDEMRRAWEEIRRHPGFEWSNWSHRPEETPRIGIGRRR